MVSRRIIIDPSHPAAMSPEQRRTELATVLAAGVIRHVGQRQQEDAAWLGVRVALRRRGSASVWLVGNPSRKA